MADQRLSVHDPEFVNKIIFEVKSTGNFDEFRRECLSDVDINPAYQNLHTRVVDSVQKFLNRQIYTPDTNKIRLREDMRMNIIRAGFLDNGVTRIVDQVVEQKLDYIQSKVEEILYKYLGVERPIKEEKKGDSLEVDTALMPNDLEQVSDKTSLDSLDIHEENEQVEEEVIEDEDFESPAFEPIGEIKIENSNLSAISGLTSQDSAENSSRKVEQAVSEQIDEQKGQTELSQISTSTQDNIPDLTAPAIGTALIISGISGEEAQMAPSLNDSIEIENKPKDSKMTPPPDEAQKSQFDLNKDFIEFTGTERKNIILDDSTNSGETEKVLQPQDVSSTPMEIDENSTDSSEMRMEIDLKDESTQETGNSSRICETSSQESVNKEKSDRKDDKKEKYRHKSSSSHHKSSRHHSSSSSKSKDDKTRHSHHKSSNHKKSDRKLRQSDDHYKEKSSRKIRSTDAESCEEKNEFKVTLSNERKDEGNKSVEQQNSSKDGKKTEQKTSIIEKHEYLKTPSKVSKRYSSEEAFHGFDEEKESSINIWFNVMDLMKKEQLPLASNVNSKDNEEQKCVQNQRYGKNELYKPKFDFRKRRAQVEENCETKGDAGDEKKEVGASGITGGV